mmetsp:Transcript_8905/g.19608  ORF Transcript_8905/g.19608 Transcript_8905/m.19608 type:complete len:296 (+) Transcript_8905:182-1069(+)
MPYRRGRRRQNYPARIRLRSLHTISSLLCRRRRTSQTSIRKRRRTGLRPRPRLLPSLRPHAPVGIQRRSRGTSPQMDPPLPLPPGPAPRPPEPPRGTLRLPPRRPPGRLGARARPGRQGPRARLARHLPAVSGGPSAGEVRGERPPSYLHDDGTFSREDTALGRGQRVDRAGRDAGGQRVPEEDGAGIRSAVLPVGRRGGSRRPVVLQRQQGGGIFPAGRKERQGRRVLRTSQGHGGGRGSRARRGTAVSFRRGGDGAEEGAASRSGEGASEASRRARAEGPPVRTRREGRQASR